MDLKDLFKDIKSYVNKSVTLKGWIRNHRDQKTFGFIEFSDGTTQEHLQVVYDEKLANFLEISKLLVGCAILVEGIIVESSGAQDYEMQAKKITLVGNCDNDYPLQAKGRPTREFLREQAYLRPRTNLFQAVFRVRNAASFAIHKFFQEHNFVYVHTPLITTTDCEGENQMFKVTTLNMDNLPIKEGKVDMSQDLFGRLAYITGSGQLHGEAFSMAYKKIYTFGPTFRTENSNTKTHANEFWMIEPEMAFCDLEENMDVMESMLKYIVTYVLENCEAEINFLDKFVENGLRSKLAKLVKDPFVRITHKEAVDILKKAEEKWEFVPDYESDIAKEHERYITKYFDAPVFITNWPKDIKAWYMKVNSDNKTVAAVDLEIPGIGELMGGSQREEDILKLRKRCEEMKVDVKAIDWYLNLRRFGGCYHSGFGLGFERLIMYLTGVENIRDVIPFPRTPGSCEY